MKRRYLLARFVSAAILLSQPAQSWAQENAREILDRAIQTLGGSAYLNLIDVKSHGRVYQFQRGELSGASVFTDYLKFPDKERTEIGDDGKIVRINNRDQGWNIDDKEVEAQLDEQVEVFWEEYKVSLDYVLRVVIAQPDSTLQYIGREMIDFKRADVLEIRNEDRTRIDLYVDRESGLLMKKTVRRLDDPSVHEEVYSNYHEIQNVLTPLLIHRYTDGLKTTEIRFDEVNYDTGLPDEFFTAEVSQ